MRSSILALAATSVLAAGSAAVAQTAPAAPTQTAAPARTDGPQIGAFGFDAAGMDRTVTPQTLRHTFAVERARAGADAGHLLELLGLVDDPRNRASVDRYLRLAEPPLG